MIFPPPLDGFKQDNDATIGHGSLHDEKYGLLLFGIILFLSSIGATKPRL